MSSPIKKKKKRSFLNKLRNVFKQDESEEGQTEFSYKQKETFDKRQSGSSEGVSCNTDEKVVLETTEYSESCGVTMESSSPEKEEYNNKNLSIQRDCKNVIIGKSKNSHNIVVDDKSAECENVLENIEQDSKLGSDRNMNIKIAFLKQENVDVTSQSYLGNTDNLHQYDKTKSPDFNSAVLQPLSNNATSDACKFLVKETKAISQESSEDSDFSADSTENSFEESSEDESERLLEKTQKYFKEDYFTKGKYITYFFLEMERQFSNPMEVYSMIHYHTACEKAKKEGTK